MQARNDETRYSLALYFTQEIIKDQGKDSPVNSKPNKKKWRRCIRIHVQKINKRQQGSHQNNFDRR